MLEVDVRGRSEDVVLSVYHPIPMVPAPYLRSSDQEQCPKI